MPDANHQPVVLAYAIVPRLVGAAAVVRGQPALLPGLRVHGHAQSDAERARITARVRADIAWCHPAALVVDPPAPSACATVEIVREAILEAARDAGIAIATAIREEIGSALGLSTGTMKAISTAVSDRHPTLLLQAARPGAARRGLPRLDFERYWSPGLVAAAAALTVFGRDHHLHAPPS